MELYHDWDSAVIAALSQYVDKFHKPWPVYGPHDVELIDYCIKRMFQLMICHQMI
ncbi:hypothetical protein SDC49_25980 [Lactobacillus sp. R2/2]|nr:hypothetical protein [Lactobacillus sp. R2/2]